VGKDGTSQERFTSRAMIETEQRLERATVRLEASRSHIVSDHHQARALARAEARGLILSAEQRDAFEQVTNAKGLSTIVGYAGTGKSAMLGVAREAWESAGYRVQGAALSGIAAENLEAGSGIVSRTIASLEHQWAQPTPPIASFVSTPCSIAPGSAARRSTGNPAGEPSASSSVSLNAHHIDRMFEMQKAISVLQAQSASAFAAAHTYVI